MKVTNKTICLRCGGKMSSIGVTKLQLGKASLVFGNWSNLLEGALEVEPYECSQCRKIEFYAKGQTGSAGGTPQTVCPACSESHDFDYPKCPYCKHQY